MKRCERTERVERQNNTCKTKQHVINNNNMYSNTASHRRVGSSPIGGRVPDTSRDGRKLFVGGLLNEGKKMWLFRLLESLSLVLLHNTSPLSTLFILYIMSAIDLNNSFLSPFGMIVQSNKQLQINYSSTFFSNMEKWLILLYYQIARRRGHVVLDLSLLLIR